MKIKVLPRLRQLLLWNTFGLAALLAAALPARAGLELSLNLNLFTANGTNYYYTIGCNLSTNFTQPLAPYGGYEIGSPGFPNAYGAGDTYVFDDTGFNEQGGFAVFYGDYNSALQGLTNGFWTIQFTDPSSEDNTNFQFAVASEIHSNSLPQTFVASPLNGTANLGQLPVFTWQGPANFPFLTVNVQNADGSYNVSSNLPPTQTSWQPATPIPFGSYTFTPTYTSNSLGFFAAAAPTNGLGQAISSWAVTTNQLQTSFTVNFTIPSPFAPASGGHVLVARYTWDGTQTDPLAASVDATGNGSSLNFGGGGGAEGGVLVTNDAVEGDHAVAFLDGDGGSLGWLGVTAPAPVLWALQGSFSVSCWIKTTQSYGNNNDYAYNGAGIVTADCGGQANDVIPMALTGGNIGFNTGGNADDTLNSQTSINDGNYHHIVVTRDLVSGMKIIYIDGRLDVSDFGSTVMLDAPKKLTLGCQADAGDGNPQDFNEYNGFDGEMDDLQVYAGILNPAEVSYLYNNRGTVAPNLPVNGLVAHYSFDNTNCVGADTSGDGYDLDYNGDPSGNGVTTTRNAIAGGAAAYFDSGSFLSYSSIPTNILAALAGDLTVAVWVRTTQDYGNDGDSAWSDPGIVAAEVPSQMNDIVPIALTGGDIGFGTDDSYSSDTLSSSGDINDGNFHQVVITRALATGEKRIYIDGNLNTSDFAATNLLNAPQLLAVGAQIDASQSNPTNANTGPFYFGVLDDLQIYSRVLSPGEISSLFQNPGSVAAALNLNFNGALDTTNLNWTTSGDADWFVEATNTYNGSASAVQSGSIVDSQQSTLTLTVAGPGSISFHWATSPRGNNFNLAFKVDGTNWNNAGPNTGWTSVGPVTLGSGQHVLTWVAAANGDADPNEAGFLDDVSFTAVAVPVITLSPSSQTNYTGQAVVLQAAATGSSLMWQWYKVGLGAITYGAASGTNTLFSPTNSGTPSVAGSYYAVVSNTYGSAITATAAVTFVSSPVAAVWTAAYRTPYYPLSSSIFSDYNGGCVADGAGNIYVANEYIGLITVENPAAAEIANLTAIGANGGAALLKYADTNNAEALAPIEWAVGLTNDSAGSYSLADCVALAPSNGAYLASIMVGTNWLGATRFVNNTGYSVLLSRFDADGNPLWSRQLGTNSAVFLNGYNDVVSDTNGYLTVAGLFSGAVDFGGANLAAASLEGFVAQYNSSGALRWVQAIPGFPAGLAESGGRLYLATSATVSGGSTNLAYGNLSAATDRAYGIAAINANNGQPLWLAGAGEPFGAGGPMDSPLIAAAGTNVFASGTAYGSPATFGGLSLVITNNHGQYFARFDTNGNARAAVAYGNANTMPWVAAADATGLYIAGDFDSYSQFGSLAITAPATPPSYLGAGYFTQPFVAKLDASGNALWALSGSSPVLGNFRGLAIEPNGVWASGFTQATNVNEDGTILATAFGANSVISDFELVGYPFGTVEFDRGGVIARITEPLAVPTPVALLNPESAGAGFQFQFQSEAGFTHTIQYDTNLAAGAGWQTYTNVPGDGSLKTIAVPLSVFGPAEQGFIRVSTR